MTQRPTPDERAAGGPDATVPTPEAPEDPRAVRVAAAVTAWRRHLVDLGGRNSLLWYRDLPAGTLDLTNAHPGGIASLMAARPTKLSDLVRERAAFEEARRRARVIRAKTLELAEERGIATGFLAIGMASWTVPGAKRVPTAPVLLRTCTLKPTGAAQQEFTVDLGAEVELNPVLRQYLHSEQGIEIDADALEELALRAGGLDPLPVFDALERACVDIPDFHVTQRLVVGNFSYAKLPMVADLATQGDGLADHDVIAALAGDPTALASVRSVLPEHAHDVDPDREFLILDADSSQQAVIDTVREGAHLVIQGPPGTGKSQTIANLIATLTSDGKSVLFVAEKRAAIDAVLSRLHRVGLSDLVLDAYDGATNKRRVAKDLGATLEGLLAEDDGGGADGATAAQSAENERVLVDARGRLTDHVAALHQRRAPWGVTAYEAQEAISALTARPHAPHSHVRLRGDAILAVTHEEVRALGRRLTEAASLGAWAPPASGTAKPDPWYAARVTTSEDAVRAQDIAARLSTGGLERVRTTMEQVFGAVRLPEGRTVADWGEVLATIGRVRDTLEVFRPQVFDMPLGDLVAASGTPEYRRAHGMPMGWWTRFRLKREARALLRPGPPPEDLHAALVDASRQRSAWTVMAGGGGGRPEIPVDLGTAEAAYAELVADLTWLGERLATTEDGGDLLHADLPGLRRRLADLAASPERLSVLPQVTGALDALREAGLGDLVDDLATRGVAADDVADEVAFVWWASLTEHLTVSDPRYGAHDGEQLRRAIRDFGDADRRHLAESATRVRGAVARRLREVLTDAPHQHALVKAEAAKSRRHRPIRDLMGRAGDALTAIKPCWAMSPLVVASLLPPGRWFDVVIFDEASQIPPAQAISAISRASQVVVAGDERQLPPTTFFTSAVDEEALAASAAASADSELLTEGVESVLDVLAATLPNRRLRWHYRSRDERLVAFANQHVYDGSLVTFPGTGIEPVVRFAHVDGTGVLEPGNESVETTPTEVERVVELVLEHARTRPDESLGVIALGVNHANRIAEAVRRRLVDADGVGTFFDEDRDERFFVKNLERVQGDERDAVILSIGYGKTPHGRVLHRFGPLNQEGGERRLNVAITRARQRMTVVSSLAAGDLDPERLKARGAVMLKDFLAYAEAGGREHGAAAGLVAGPAATGAAAEVPAGVPAGVAADQAAGGAGGPGASVLLADFVRRLREADLVVHERYGASGHPIDLAVEDPHHPGRLAVAVETDGPRYAAMRNTRDRDRLRAEQLGRLGWTHVRLWTTDVYRDPMRELARVLTAARHPEFEVTNASAASGGHPAPGSAPDGGAVLRTVPPAEASA